MKKKNFKYLTKCIYDTIEYGELSPDFKASLISNDGNEIIRQTEGELWDYKETINWGDPMAISKLASQILAFHNNKGGVLIFGVKEKDSSFRLVGYPNSMILDNSRLYDKLRKYIGLDNIFFQERIPINGESSRSIWLIFINGRKEKPPKPILRASPDHGRSFKNGQYFIRINDEIKKCTDPIHYERLFSGVSSTHLKAYTYEVDKPFFRLLLPHTEKFIGRKNKKEDIFNFLKSRYFILSLDGPGGIGKSALAIDVVKSLYEGLEYDFIISLSAKNKVWIGYSGSKQSDFSGLSEFLREIAKVLCIDSIGRSTEELKVDILNFIEGLNGLILIDNIEEINDQGIFEFIQSIPYPVKIIVTSRVSKDLGALRIDVPRMSDEEAKELLKYELRFHNYQVKLGEEAEIKLILESCGYLPLAIKWAASFINSSNCTNLRGIYNKVKQMDSSKKEFLDYIFSTMYDELSETAQHVALLSIYLDIRDWTETSCAIILNKDEGEINEAIFELEDRDILIGGENDQNINQRNMLPITVQFLKQKWHENRNLRIKVEKSIEELIPLSNEKDSIFDLSIPKRLEEIYSYTSLLEKQNNYPRASRLVKLARQWLHQDDIDETLSIKLSFLEGKLIYFRDRENGILRMKWSLEGHEGNKELNYEWVFLAIAIMNYGRQPDEKEAFNIFQKKLGSLPELPEEFHSSHFERFFAKRRFDLILTGLSRINDPIVAYKMFDDLRHQFQNNENMKEMGSNIHNFFNMAKRCNHCKKNDHKIIKSLITLYN